jgi:hypothetical protein
MSRKKSKIPASFSSFLSIDSNNQKCLDKIERINLVHGTGQVTIITTLGKEFRTRISSLVSELKVDQEKEIIQGGFTIFEDIIRFQYTNERVGEFDRIIKETKLKILSTIEVPPLYSIRTDIFEVSVFVHSTNPNLNISQKVLK